MQGRPAHWPELNVIRSSSSISIQVTLCSFVQTQPHIPSSSHYDERLSSEDLSQIRSLLTEHPTWHRTQISHTGENKSYSMEDFALNAFSVFFTQCPSFLAHQKAMQQTKAQNNATSFFEIGEIPSDNQIRQMLDPVQPQALYPSNSHFVLQSYKRRPKIGADSLSPGGLQRQRRAPSQPVGNAPGQRRKNILRAEGPPYHPRRWTLVLGRCPRLGWHWAFGPQKFLFSPESQAANEKRPSESSGILSRSSLCDVPVRDQPSFAKDRRNRSASDFMSQVCQCPLDASVAPRTVLLGDLHDQAVFAWPQAAFVGRR